MNTYQHLSIFLQSLEARGRAPKTIRAYRDRVMRVIGLLPDGPVTTEGLESVIVILRRSGLAPASVAGHVQAVKTFYHWLHLRGHIEKDPAKPLERPRLDRSSNGKAISQGDVIRMVAYCQDNDLVMERAVIMMLADTGCRVGELISIQLASLNLAVREAVCSGKTGVRDLYYTEPTADAIRAWIALRPNTCPALFAIENGPVTYTRIYNALERVGKAVNAVRYNPHSFRHGVGQCWIDQGANLEVVRIKLGHRDITTTAQIYGNQDKTRIKRASERYSVIRV